MFFTGLHADYHRPSDDADKINHEGVQQIAQLMFKVVCDAADEPTLPAYRAAAKNESPGVQVNVERPLAPLPGRLGVWWDEKAPLDGAIVVTRVINDSAAARAGVRVGDRIVRFAGQPITTYPAFRANVLSAVSPAPAVLERKGETQPVSLDIRLTGEPVRLGITWRVNEAEPDCVILSRVVPGSPADLAGLAVHDRIYCAAGQTFHTSDEFRTLMGTLPSPIELVSERLGQVRTVQLVPHEDPAGAAASSAADDASN